MGWFFKKKKKVDVPVPMRKIEEGALQFGKIPTKSQEVTPSNLKTAAGIENIPPSMAPKPVPSIDAKKDPFASLPGLNQAPPAQQQPIPSLSPYNDAEEFRYLRVQPYKRVLGELETLKQGISALGEISRKIHVSEYNEERNFARLKNTVRSIHDRFLTIDKTLFKS